MKEELNKKVISSFSWSFLERLSSQGINFVFSIILARLLLPSDFGLIAMLSIFMAFAHVFINSGFGQALIQKESTTYIDECSVFYFNIVIAFIMAGLIFFLAPWIAEFYNQPLLTSMTRVLSLSLIFNSFGLIQRSLCSKKLDFKIQFKVSIITVIISGPISLLLAFNGYGVWSLVILYIVNDLLNTILFWVFSAWRPSLKFSFISLKTMFGFGSRLLIVSLMNSLFSNIYILVIGKLYSAKSLGFYSRAEVFYKFPIDAINQIFSSVSFPTFSLIQNDLDKLSTYSINIIKTTTLITFPLMFGLIVVARPLVEVLLTEKWIEIVPYLQLLCVIGLINPIQRVNYNVINSMGRSDLFLKLEIVDKIFIISAIAISYKFEILGLIYGQIIVLILSYCINMYCTAKLLNYSFFFQIRAILPSLLISIVMGFLVYNVKYLLIENQLHLLFVQVFSGVIIYILLCYFTKLESFMNIINKLNLN